MSMDKSGKQFLKDEAEAERAKERWRERKARTKAKHQARKPAGKKTKETSDSSSTSSGSSSSDESSDSSSSSGRSTPRGKPFNCKLRFVSSGMTEFKIINGKRPFKSQTRKWVDCSCPHSKPCHRCEQRHLWDERKEFDCSRLAGTCHARRRGGGVRIREVSQGRARGEDDTS